MTTYSGPPLGPLRHRRRGKGFLHYSQDLRAPPFHDGHEPAELESHQLDEARGAHGAKAEVGEEVRREDRLVDLEALVLRFALRIPVREGLERLRPLVPSVA